MAAVQVLSPLLAPIPGLRHAFSTRVGGVSEAPFDALNMGAGLGDDPSRVAANRERFRAALGFGPLVQVDQVHGTELARVRAGGVLELREEVVEAPVEADALWTDVPGLALAIRTADCAPILVAARDAEGRARAVAAIHAGWRGAAAGIVACTVKTLGAAGFDPAHMVASVGPCIGPAAFEVGDEVVDAARVSLGGEAPRTRRGPRGRPLLDLFDWTRRLLVRAGIPEASVDVLEACTHDRADLYFSHRRDQGRTGRHLSVIELSP